MYNKYFCISLYVWLLLLGGMPVSFSWICRVETVWAQSPSDISGMIKAGHNSFYCEETVCWAKDNRSSELGIKPTAVADTKIQAPADLHTPIKTQAILENEEEISQQIPDESQIPAETGPEAETPQPAAEPENKSNIKKQRQDLPAASTSPSRGKKRPLTDRKVSKKPSKRMVTLNFDDADVFTIIQTIFGEVLKVNYVVDPRIKGRVTFRAVTPVPFEQVLPLMEVILRINGIGIVEESGLYRIVPISDISKEPSPVSFGRDPLDIRITGKALVQVVQILYVQSSDILKLLTPFTSGNAVLIDVPKSNQIIIVDTDANVKRLLQLVNIFDNENLKTTKPQVFVYSVQNGKAKDIATILQQTFLGTKSAVPATVTATETGAGAPTVTPAAMGSPAGYSPSAPGGSPTGRSPAVSGGGPTVPSSSPVGQSIVSDFTKFIPDEVTNSIIILSTPEEYILIKSAIDRIDIYPRQVVIEGMVAAVTLTDNLTLGLSAWINGRIGEYNVGGGLFGTNLSGVDFTKPFGNNFTLYAINDAGSIQFLITALATDSKAKLLATPHILVSDNREAKIQIGQSVPLVTSETYGSTTVAPQRTIQYRDIGVILKVKPRVNESGLVALDLYQEVSTFSTIKLYNNEDQIILNNDNAATNVVVQDGQTIIIGGLIREDLSKSRSGIPFLSKIPYIGWLFGNWSDDKSRTEIIILLTPRVIKSQKQASDVTKKYIDNMAGESQGRITREELMKGRPEGKIE